MIGIQAVGEERLGDFVELLEEAGGWLWQRGIAQWPPGSSRPQLPLLRAMLELGTLSIASAQSQSKLGSPPPLKLAGGCIVTTAASMEWQGAAAAAATLHKLVVAREFAGRGLGARLVAWAEGWARQQELDLLRLDCWDGNSVLRQFYRDLGFDELHAVESYGSQVRLFEKRLPRR